MAGNVIKNGSAELIKNGFRLSFDPRNGWQQSIGFTGPLDKAIAYAKILSGYGIACEVNKDKSPDATVTLLNNALDADGNANEKPIDSWQLLGNENQKSILEHPLWLYAAYLFLANRPLSITWDLDQILKYNIQSWQASASSGQQYPPASTDGATDDQIQAWNFWDGTAGGDLGSHPEIQTVYTAFQQLMKKGQDHYAVANYVLRHTRTVSDQYSQDILDSNPERLYTTGQLITECTDASLTFPLPTRLQNKLNAIPAPSSVAGYLWSWRKMPSTESTAANRKVEITVDYVLEQWNATLYTPVA